MSEEQSQKAFAIARSLRISPKKLNLVASSIRKSSILKAEQDLLFMNKRISKDVLKCLRSAVANAEHNQNLDIDSLYIDQVWVGKGIVMKRMRPRARGRASRILKPMAHLTIVLSEKKEVKNGSKN